MRIITSLLTTFVLIPVMAIACHCCPLAAQDDATLRIEKAPCHSCCDEGSEIVRDCGAIQEKQVFNVPHSSNLLATTAAQVRTAYLIQEEKQLSIVPSSPPSVLLSLTTVLRI